jgi:Cu-processing system ATP-binding protein
MISIHQLRKHFGKNAVLRGIDLELTKPGISAILGPNGSGKTTLLKCILGLVIPDSGNILFKGEPIKNRHLYRLDIAHVPQMAHFPENLSPTELLRMSKDLHPGITREDFLIDLFELGGEMHKKMGNLSGGNRQKVNLLLGLMYDNPVIILDEPSNGLDPLSFLNLKKFLLEEGRRNKQILITTHMMSFVEEIADHIIFILDGQIYFNGSPDELIHHEGETGLEEAIANILRTRMYPDYAEDL